MSAENPLLILGVPKHVLATAIKDRNFKLALDVAESNYKTLVKHFHPDRHTELEPTQKVAYEDYMVQIADAVDELRDIDALEYYVNELISKSEVATLQTITSRLNQLQNKNSQLSRTVANLIRLFNISSEELLLGQNESLLVVAGSGRFITTIEISQPIKGHNYNELNVYTHKSIQTSILDFEFRFFNGALQFRHAKTIDQLGNSEGTEIDARYEAQIAEVLDQLRVYERNKKDNRAEIFDCKESIKRIEKEWKEDLKAIKQASGAGKKRVWTKFGEPVQSWRTKSIGFFPNLSGKETQLAMIDGGGNGLPNLYSHDESSFLEKLIFGNDASKVVTELTSTNSEINLGQNLSAGSFSLVMLKGKDSDEAVHIFHGNASEESTEVRKFALSAPILAIFRNN